VSTKEGDCVTFNTAEEQRQTAVQKPTSKSQGPNSQEGDKQTIAEFEAAEKRGNYRVAFDIAKKMDMAGDPAGAYGLGLLFAHGEGVDKNEHQAFDSFHKAAIAGYGMAQYKLGVMYHRGLGGVRKDPRSAYSWYEKAAKNDVVEAMIALSGMCHRGEGGLTPDCEQDWLDQAENTGHKPDQ
jgi:hypothetical protein